jgi:hypothetical protein
MLYTGEQRIEVACVVSDYSFVGSILHLNSLTNLLIPTYYTSKKRSMQHAKPSLPRSAEGDGDHRSLFIEVLCWHGEKYI